MRNTSRNINIHGGIEKLDPNISIPETWAEHSNRNIQESQSSRSNSQRLRSDVDNLVTQCANDMWSSWNNTNTSLQQRVTETTEAHNKLTSHLSKSRPCTEEGTCQIDINYFEPVLDWGFIDGS